MNAILTKCCADCFIVLPLADFPDREANGRPYKASTCPDCTRRRWRLARKRCNARKASQGVKRPANPRSRPAPVEVRPYWPLPVNFLPMGEPDRGVALRWSL